MQGVGRSNHSFDLQVIGDGLSKLFGMLVWKKV